MRYNHDTMELTPQQIGQIDALAELLMDDLGISDGLARNLAQDEILGLTEAVQPEPIDYENNPFAHLWAKHQPAGWDEIPF